MSIFRGAIENLGYKIEQSYYDPNLFKTNASVNIIYDILKQYKLENYKDDYYKNIDEKTYKYKILSKEIKVKTIFKESINNNKTASLYKCKIKYIKYYGQGGKILNEIKTVLDKKKEKDIKRSELDPNDAFISGGIFGAIGLISLAGLAFPPLEIVAALGYVGSVTACAISEVVGLSKVGINAYINSDFKNDELREFLDESN